MTFTKLIDRMQPTTKPPLKRLLRAMLFLINCSLPDHLSSRHLSLELCTWLEVGGFWGDLREGDLRTLAPASRDAVMATPRLDKAPNAMARDRPLQAAIAAIQVAFAVTEGDGLENLQPGLDESARDTVVLEAFHAGRACLVRKTPMVKKF